MINGDALYVVCHSFAIKRGGREDPLLGSDSIVHVKRAQLLQSLCESGVAIPPQQLEALLASNMLFVVRP